MVIIWKWNFTELLLDDSLNDGGGRPKKSLDELDPCDELALWEELEDDDCLRDIVLRDIP